MHEQDWSGTIHQGKHVVEESGCLFLRDCRYDVLITNRFNVASLIGSSADAEAIQTKNNFLNTVAENKVSITTLLDLILKAKGSQFPRDVTIAVRELTFVMTCDAT